MNEKIMLGIMYAIVILAFAIFTIILFRQNKKSEKDKAIKNKIIDAMASTYYMICQINISKDTYEMLMEIETEYQHAQKNKKASGLLNELCETFVDKKNHDEIKRFLNVSEMGERLKNTNYVTYEYESSKQGFVRIFLIKLKSDEHGNVTDVLMLNQKIDEERVKHLEKSYVEANRANNAKTDFLSRMSHDIRTPMNSIVGMAEIARMNKGNKEKVHECLENIELAGRHMQILINDILDISAIESGKLKINMKTEKVNKVTDAINMYIGSLAKKKGVEYEYVEKNIVYQYVKTDALRVNQILINLLSNAVKYTPKGGKVLFELSEEANTIKVRIKDNGIGMSKEFMEVMFDAFTRAIDTRINKIEGSGLGLAIVKQLTELMDGTIYVSSELGVGTEFILSFPLYIVDDIEEENKIENEQDYSKLKNMKILLAEDNEFNYKIARELFIAYDVNLVRAENGQIAVEMFKDSYDGEYDVIIMDIQMPVMDGLSATKIIRELGRKDSKTIPIIAMTANAFEEDIDACMKAGMNKHIAKPIRVKNVLSSILEYA